MAVIGDTLRNRYRIIDRLGEGGQSKVYLGFDTGTNSKCVVKEMKNPQDPDEEEKCLSLFQQEYILLKDFNHPLLIKVHDFFQEKGLWFIIEEFVEGRTLESIVAKDPALSEDAAVLFAVDLADVLSYLHQHNIIYRDIKPANVIIDTNQKARLIDFTIARVYKPKKHKDTICIGTEGYAPPEQYGRGQTDSRSDIYALGALLYQLVTGTDPASTPFTFNFSHPYPQIKPVIEKAVKLDSKKRYKSMTDFKKALLEEYKKLSTPTASSPAYPQAPVLSAPPSVVSSQAQLSIQQSFIQYSKTKLPKQKIPKPPKPIPFKLPTSPLPRPSLTGEITSLAMFIVCNMALFLLWTSGLYLNLLSPFLTSSLTALGIHLFISQIAVSAIASIFQFRRPFSIKVVISAGWGFLYFNVLAVILKGFKGNWQSNNGFDIFPAVLIITLIAAVLITKTWEESI